MTSRQSFWAVLGQISAVHAHELLLPMLLIKSLKSPLNWATPIS